MRSPSPKVISVTRWEVSRFVERCEASVCARAGTETARSAATIHRVMCLPPRAGRALGRSCLGARVPRQGGTRGGCSGFHAGVRRGAYAGLPLRLGLVADDLL